MSSKAIRDLKPGDVVQLRLGESATVKKAYRDPLFEGDVWTVEHTYGEDTAPGSARVALTTTGA